MATHVALLRGINLGSARRVSMPALREALTAAGYAGVQTLLQSGNVVLDAPGADPRALERALARQLEAAFAMAIPVVVRTREELADVVANDPFGALAHDPTRYQVSFLSGEPEPSKRAALLGEDFGSERVAVRGREIYAWHPDGLAGSELARRLTPRGLGVADVTARNWRTVTRLHALAGGD